MYNNNICSSNNNYYNNNNLISLVPPYKPFRQPFAPNKSFQTKQKVFVVTSNSINARKQKQ